jgi:PAS domain S-box-containing protein
MGGVRNSRRKRKDELKPSGSDDRYVGMFQVGSSILQTHLAMIRSEREMLDLHQTVLDQRQRLIQQNEQRIQEANLRLSQGRFHVLVESLPCLICHLDHEQRFRFCNRAYGHALGISVRNVLGKYLWEVIGGSSYDAMRPGIVRAFQGKEVTCELNFPQQKDQHFYCKFVPERNDGSVIGILIMLLDISDRKAIERQLTQSEQKFRQIADERAELLKVQAKLLEETKQASRSKDLFLATVSHELRTPMTSILGWVSLMSQKKIDADHMDQAVQAIERNARNQVNVIDELLDISRIAYGKLELKIENVNVAVLARATIDALLPSMRDKKVKLEWASVERRLTNVKGDSFRLQQVFYNLLRNAIKFTPDGGLIKVAVKNAKSRVVVQVSDTGKGISKEFLPHIFEPFQQADMSSTRSTGGLGLGLAISYRLIEMHAGTLRAGSRGPGQGATFKVSLPFSGPHRSHLAGSKSDPEPSSS